MPIKSFRGKLGDGDIETIALHTNNGSTGYRIIKMELFPANPGLANQESVVKIFSIPQTTATSATDFDDNTMLAVGLFKQNEAPAYTDNEHHVVFDNTPFNQDIYVTHKDASSGEECNYYIELEQVTLDLSANTVATLKDIRNIKSNQ